MVDDAPPLDIVPWKLSVPAVRFDLDSFKKDTTNPEIYKQLYLQLISEYPLSEFFFTDGSKTEEGVAPAAVSTKRITKIFYMSVPGHVGIRANSAADSAAKDALDGDISVELIPFSDLKSRTHKYKYNCGSLSGMSSRKTNYIRYS